MTRVTAAIALVLMVAFPATGQETTSADDLRAVLADLRDWPPDYSTMTKELAKALKKQKSKVRKFFRNIGEIETVTFWDTFKEVDLYLVSSEHGRIVMRFRRDDSGKVEDLRYWIVGL